MKNKINTMLTVQNIMDRLYRGETVNVNALSNEFNYSKSSMYKLLRKMSMNFRQMSRGYLLCKCSVGNFMLKKCKIINDFKCQDKIIASKKF